MMGKVYHEIERRAAPLKPWDLLVFDAPASGQALSMIRSPFAAEETFGESVVGREARNIARLLSDRRKCTDGRGDDGGGARDDGDAGGEIARWRRWESRPQRSSLTAPVRPRSKRAISRDWCAAERARRNCTILDMLADIARAELQRRMRERRAHWRSCGGNWRCEVIEIEECCGQSGAALIDRLAAAIEREGAAGGVEVQA